MDASSLAMMATSMQVGGGVAKGFAANADGKSSEATAEYVARMHERKGAEELAAATRKAEERRKTGERVLGQGNQR